MKKLEEQLAARLFSLLSFSRPIEQSLDDVLKFILDIYKCDAGHFFIYNEDRETIRLIAAAARSSKGENTFQHINLPDIERSLGEGIEGWVAREKAPLYVQNLESDPRYIPIPLPNGDSINWFLGIPIAAGVQLAGVLTIGGIGPSGIFPEEIHTLSYISPYLAEFVLKVIHNKHLEEQLQELSFIMRIINLADAAGQDTNKLLRALEAELPRFFPAFNSRIHLPDTCDLRSYCAFVKDGHGLIQHCPAIGKKLPLIVNDTTSPLSCKAIHNTHSASLMCIPLSAHRSAHGVLQMEGGVTGSFSEEQIEFYMAIGNQIASVLEKSQVQAHLEERVRELTGVYDVAAFELGAFTGGGVEQDSFLSEASELIKRILKVDKVLVFLVEKHNNEQVLVDAITNSAGVVENVGDGIAGWVVKHGKPWNSKNILDDHRMTASSVPYANEMRGILAVPMMVGKRRIGAIVAGTTINREFVSADIKLLQLVASRVAIAVENAQLQAIEARRQSELLAKHKTLKKQSEDLAKANKNLSILYELHQTLGSTLELQPLLERVLEQIAAVIDVPLNAITVHLVDLDRERLDIVAQRGLPSSLVSKYQFKFEDIPHSKLMRLLKEQRALILHDLAQDPEMRLLVRGRVRSFYAIPLVAKDRMQGILTLAGARKRAVPQEKLELIRAISNQLAISIENARLYQSSLRYAELNRFVSTVRSLLNLDDRLYQIVKNSASLLSQEFTVIALLDENGLFKMRAHFGLPKELASDEILHLDPELENILLEGRIMVLPECGREVFSPIPFELKECNGSMIAVPLKSKDKVLGILILGNFHSVQYSREEIELVTLIANQMGVAVENSLLYHNAILERNTLEALVRGMADGVVTIDLNGKITSFNKAAERLTGYNGEEVIGHRIQEVFKVKEEEPPVYLPDYSIAYGKKTFEELKVGVQQEGVLYQHFIGDETSQEQIRMDISSIHTLLFNEQHEPASWIMVFRDVTKEKQLAQAKNDFVAMASHDLRTPLTAIKGYAVTLLRHDKKFDETTQKEFLKVINSEIDRLSRLLDNLLNLSRIEAGRLAVRKDTINFYELARKTIDVFKLSATKHEFVINISSDFPLVQADQDQIEQILNNLVSNAIKYAPAGGTITIAANIAGNEWIGSVSDQGVGIPKDQLAYLFKRFHRIDSKLTRHVSGTGLGLFITHSLIEAQGGRIWVESEPGHGTTFSFAIPIADTKTE